MSELMKVVYVAGPFRCASTHMPGQQDSWGIGRNEMREKRICKTCACELIVSRLRQSRMQFTHGASA